MKKVADKIGSLRIRVQTPVMVGILGLVLCVMLSWDTCAFGQTRKLVLNTAFSSPITSLDKTGFLDLLYRELFNRLNIAFEIQSIPAERALTNVNEGIDDGDVCRVPDLAKVYTNMVRTTEPVMQYNIVVFSRDKQFRVDGPESLKPYIVGIVTGWKHIERDTAQLRSRIMLDSAEQLFQMLDQGRVDVAVIERVVGMDMVQKLQISGINILSPPLLTGDWYLYLHKRHADMIPLIDGELSRMKTDGSFDRIKRGVLGQYEQGMVHTAPIVQDRKVK